MKLSLREEGKELKEAELRKLTPIDFNSLNKIAGKNISENEK